MCLVRDRIEQCYKFQLGKIRTGSFLTTACPVLL
jgi:hypothetical protein